MVKKKESNWAQFVFLYFPPNPQGTLRTHGWMGVGAISAAICSKAILTFFKVVCFSDIDKYERHELELREALAGGGGDGEEVSQLVDLVVYVISP